MDSEGSPVAEGLRKHGGLRSTMRKKSGRPTLRSPIGACSGHGPRGRSARYLAATEPWSEIHLPQPIQALIAFVNGHLNSVADLSCYDLRLRYPSSRRGSGLARGPFPAEGSRQTRWRLYQRAQRPE